MTNGNTRIFLGQSDLDGVSFAVLLEHFSIPFQDLMICDYDLFEYEERLQYIQRFDEVFFVDFSPEEFFFHS